MSSTIATGERLASIETSLKHQEQKLESIESKLDEFISRADERYARKDELHELKGLIWWILGTVGASIIAVAIKLIFFQ